MNKPVITRFAPSPTGFLHIGGARTALFNWLYAKANGGKMLLRIEDTDRQRSTEEAIVAIKDGLSWLGLNWDGDAISQYARAERHREVAHQMVEAGTAYRCYCTAEELEAMREQARDEGRNPMYDGTWRDRTDSPDLPFVIRLKTPLDGETVVHDQVQGDVKFPNKDLDDLILLRSDGNPTYMLAVVVDDHDMGVTHIIRGDDHLTNAARQSIIFNAMNWDVPVMAHIPLIHGADGAKLSKRHGAIGAEAYRAMGYLPEGLRNYLVRLGWAHGNDEIMSTEQLIDWFGFDGMNKGASRFDFTKLEAINAHYIKNSDDSALFSEIKAVLHELEGGDFIKANTTPEREAIFSSAIGSLKERAKTLIQIVQGAKFIFEDLPLEMEEKANALLDTDGLSVIRAITPEFEAISDWNHDNIAEIIKNFAEKHDLKLGKVAQPIRAALTGKNTSPGAFDVLTFLGKKETIKRLKFLL